MWFSCNITIWKNITEYKLLKMTILWNGRTRMKAFIKNINHEQILSLANQIDVLKGQVVSKTLAQNSAISMTLFAFDKGEEISSHDSTGDAMVTVLEGTGKFTVDGKEYTLNANETLIMPAKKPHAIFAEQAFKMFLVVVFPKNEVI